MMWTINQRVNSLLPESKKRVILFKAYMNYDLKHEIYVEDWREGHV